jgi:hypothetical protein
MLDICDDGSVDDFIASPTVCQIGSTSFIFGEMLKTPLQQFSKGLDNFWHLGKIYLQRTKIRARSQLGIGVSQPGERVEKEIKNKKSSQCKCIERKNTWRHILFQLDKSFRS